MRLSLRTLLAFEDNVFDVEQHRRLEQLLPSDKDAEATLLRIRSVVRNPRLAVPGLVDHQEELDPNYVAEYLDHQMSSSVQEKFESYCLSADKYLAEIASLHHILSNVLGEPARTSRECRHQCYDALGTKPTATGEKESLTSSMTIPMKHFRPDAAHQESLPAPSAPFWKRWFPSKPAPPAPVAPAQKEKSSLWTFTVMGLCICALLLGWQQIEKKRAAHQQREATLTETVMAENGDSPQSLFHNQSREEEIPDDRYSILDSPLYGNDSPRQAEESMFTPFTPVPEPSPIEQTAFTMEVSTPDTAADTTSESSSTADPFMAVADADPPAPEPPSPNAKMANIHETKESPEKPEEGIVAFQSVTGKTPADVPNRQNSRPPLPATAWQPHDAPSRDVPLRDAPSPDELAPPQHIPVVETRHSSPNPPPLPMATAVSTVPLTLGRAMPMAQPSVVFTAASARDPWQLPALPFDVVGEQYLLTAAPFRGMIELAGSFRIEMIGDTKFCILPLDESGVPGIFIDYGRIIISPMKTNRSLRIETETSRSAVTVPSIDSLLFVDTFAEIADPQGKAKLPEEQRSKRSPILGFVPHNEDKIVWQAFGQPQPLIVETQGSMILQSNQYRFGEIRHLPNWLRPMPMPPEDCQLANVCQQYFIEARGDGEKALTRMTQNDSPPIRALGLRLWGDLGRFDVPLAVRAEKRPEDEAVRLILGRYFREVMLRDAETIQCLADAIEVIKAGVRSQIYRK
jgi:hypothetical protein